MSKWTDALFPKSTLAVLSTLFMRPDGLHLRGLMSATGLGSASAQRELKKLLGAGMLTRKENGKVLLYQPNTASPVYAELRSIIAKTDGVAEKLKILLAYGAAYALSLAALRRKGYRPANRHVVF